MGDFKAKSKNWYTQDKTGFEGKTITSISSEFGLYQLINEPTHLLENSSSCIDLISTSQSNLVVESGVHPSLHPNCHHQVVFAKFNLMISYPPLYSREVWHYREANTDLIRRAISNFICKKKPSIILMLPKKYLFLMKKSEMFSTTTFRMKP